MPPGLAFGGVEETLARMSVRAKVGQLVMPFLPGTYAAYDGTELDRVHGWIDSLQLGGVIVSIGSPIDIAAKLDHLQRRSRLPLLVAADLEGGSAFRFTGGTPFPTNMGIAATGRDRDAYEVGRITALEGRAVGIHLVFAPVADVNSNPDNPIINTRSFGEDPARVSRLVTETVRGMQDNGILATAKHFPGHGDTETDSHISLPVIRSDWARLDSVELAPFRAAVRSGVTAIMSAHIALLGIDTASEVRAGTVAPNILSGLLRDSLGFRGLVVTDALDMGALVAIHGPEETAVRAFLAGADLLLQPSDPRATVEAMVAAVAAGRFSMARLDASVRRMLELKERMGLFRKRTVPLDSIGAIVGQRAFMDTARAVTARSLVLVKDSAGTMDRLVRGNGPIAVVSYGESNWATVGGGLTAALRREGRRVTLFRLTPASGPASYDSARTVLRAAEHAVFATSVRPTTAKGSIALPMAAAALIAESARDHPTLLVSFGSPYLLSQVPAAPAYLLAWTSNPLTEDAVARAILGAPITGTLPVSLPSGQPLGFGIRRPGR